MAYSGHVKREKSSAIAVGFQSVANQEGGLKGVLSYLIKGKAVQTASSEAPAPRSRGEQGRTLEPLQTWLVHTLVAMCTGFATEKVHFPCCCCALTKAPHSAGLKQSKWVMRHQEPVKD